MYTDAYPCAVPSDRLEELADAATPCWSGNDAHEAWTCALGAAGGSLCPCLALAAGGIGGERERAILEAIAAEMRNRAERRLRHGSAQRSPGPSARVVTGPAPLTRSDRTCPRCGVALPSVAVRGRLLASSAPIGLADEFRRDVGREHASRPRRAPVGSRPS